MSTFWCCKVKREATYERQKAIKYDWLGFKDLGARNCFGMEPAFSECFELCSELLPLFCEFNFAQLLVQEFFSVSDACAELIYGGLQLGVTWQLASWSQITRYSEHKLRLARLRYLHDVLLILEHPQML